MLVARVVGVEPPQGIADAAGVLDGAIQRAGSTGPVPRPEGFPGMPGKIGSSGVRSPCPTDKGETLAQSIARRMLPSAGGLVGPGGVPVGTMKLDATLERPGWESSVAENAAASGGGAGNAEGTPDSGADLR